MEVDGKKKITEALRSRPRPRRAAHPHQCGALNKHTNVIILLAMPCGSGVKIGQILEAFHFVNSPARVRLQAERGTSPGGTPWHTKSDLHRHPISVLSN